MVPRSVMVVQDALIASVVVATFQQLLLPPTVSVCEALLRNSFVSQWPVEMDKLMDLNNVMAELDAPTVCAMLGLGQPLLLLLVV